MSRRNEVLSERSYMVNGVPVRDTRNQQGAAEIVHRLHVNRTIRDAVRLDRAGWKSIEDAAVYDEQGALASQADRFIARHVRWFAWAVALLCVGYVAAAYFE